MTVHNCKKTPGKVDRAQELRAQNWTYEAIGAFIGISAETAHRWTDPIYNAKRAGRERRRDALRELTGPRNQYIAPELPTLPYVPHITLGTNSKYQMTRPS